MHQWEENLKADLKALEGFLLNSDSVRELKKDYKTGDDDSWTKVENAKMKKRKPMVAISEAKLIDALKKKWMMMTLMLPMSLKSPKLPKSPRSRKLRSVARKSLRNLAASYIKLSDPEVRKTHRLIRGNSFLPQSPPPSPAISPVPPPQQQQQGKKRSFDQMASPTPPPPPKRIKTA